MGRRIALTFVFATVAIGLLVCGAAAAAPDSSSIAGLTSPSVLSMIAATATTFSTMALAR